MEDFIRLLCDLCGEPFTHPAHSAGRPRRYCSRECQSRASSRDYRARQKRRLSKAEREAVAPAATDAEVRDALKVAFETVAELHRLRAVLRVPQRMDEAHEQVRAARDQIDDLAGRLDLALKTLARGR